jgi:hypothetical protein
MGDILTISLVGTHVASIARRALSEAKIPYTVELSDNNVYRFCIEKKNKDTVYTLLRNVMNKELERIGQ